MPPKKAGAVVATAASSRPPRSKRATPKTRTEAAEEDAQAPSRVPVGRESRSGRQRRRSLNERAGAAPSRSRSRSPVGEEEEEPQPQSPPAKRRIGRPRSRAPSTEPAESEEPTPAAAANPATMRAIISRNKPCTFDRTTDAPARSGMEAAARAAAAAAAAAAVVTERTVSVVNPALRQWFRSAPFRVAEFARAGREALEEVDRVLVKGGSGSSAAPLLSLAPALLLSEAEKAATAAAPAPEEAAAEAAAAPPPPAPATPGSGTGRSPRTQPPELPPLIPLGKAVALGPGGGRPLLPGKDVLVTLALSEAGRPERPLRELVFLATPSPTGEGAPTTATLRDAREAFRGACPADAAAEELGVAVAGAYFAVEGVIYTDRNASSSSSSPSPAVGTDYAAPILEFLAATGSFAPLPPSLRDGDASEAGAAAAVPAEGTGRGPRAGVKAPSSAPALPPSSSDPPPPPPWRSGELSTANLQDLTLRLGGGGGYIFCHQGGCEHALAVRDVRLAGADDAPSSSAAATSEEENEEAPERHPPTSGDFPLELFRARPPKARSCQSCGSRRAAKATWRDAAAPSDPAFWCARCYSDAHYDDGGRLLVPEHRVVEYRGG